MHSKFFVIWGMHRGGTSLMAAAMRIFGAEITGSLLPADRFNPSGYFETQELVSLNEGMLAELGQRWYGLGYIGHEQLQILIKTGHLDKAIAFLKKQAEHSPLVLMKDPRMARLGMLWEKAFAACDIAPYSVIAWRNPHAVAISLRTRAQNLKFPTPVLDERYSWLLWLAYTRSALLYTSLWPRVLVNYDRLLEDPAGVLQCIAASLGLPLGEKVLAEFCQSFVDKRLNHYHQQEETCQMPEKVQALYELLSSATGCECPDLQARAWEPTSEEKLMGSLLDEANRKIRENAAKMASIHSEICILSGECKRMALELAELKK